MPVALASSINVMRLFSSVLSLSATATWLAFVAVTALVALVALVTVTPAITVLRATPPTVIASASSVPSKSPSTASMLPLNIVAVIVPLDGL